MMKNGQNCVKIQLAEVWFEAMIQHSKSCFWFMTALRDFGALPPMER